MPHSDDGGRVRPAGASASLAVVNGLRGWAIAAVVWHHMAQPLLTPPGFAAQEIGGYLVTPQALLSHGAFGVNLFFVLSGLVLALPYARGVRRMETPGDVGQYYARRALRLLPLYYLVITVSLFVRPLNKMSSDAFLRDASSLATFTFTFDEHRWFSWYDPVLWSLAVEFWFSVVFPLVVIAWQRFGIRRVLLVVLPISFAVRLYATLRHPNVASMLDIVKDSPAGRLDDFVVGMAIAPWLVRRRPAWSARSVILALLAGLALLTLCANGWDNVLKLRVPYPFAAAINDVLAGAFALIIAALLASPPKLVALPFVTAPIQLIGMMSYSIYLWHAAGGRTLDTGPDDALPYLVLCLLLSALTYRFVEFPKRTVRQLFVDFPRLPPH